MQTVWQKTKNKTKIKKSTSKHTPLIFLSVLLISYKVKVLFIVTLNINFTQKNVLGF